MSSILNIERALLIPDESERIFAVAVLASFPSFEVVYQPTLSSIQGHLCRVTQSDLGLKNSKGEVLFVEITAGNKKTKRKRRQRKSANLAGYGLRYAVLYGADIEQIKTASSDTVKQKVIEVLKGKFNGKLFSFE